MAQTVKHLPAMRETQVRSLGWEDPLEKEIATHSCLENSMDGGGWWATVHRVAKSRTQLSDFASLRTRSAGSQGHLGVWLPRSPPPLVEEERNMREHLPSSGEPLPRRL